MQTYHTGPGNRVPILEYSAARHGSWLSIFFAYAWLLPGMAGGTEEMPAVRFGFVPAKVGDSTGQRFSIALTFQEASGVKNSVVQSQRRLVTVEEVQGELAVSVRVRFDEAQRRSESAYANGRKGRPTVLLEPVTGQEYLATRKGEELLVSDLAGDTPGDLETSFVKRTMAAIGLPNPLTEFLRQRSVHVGESLHLPEKAALNLLGLENQAGAKASCDLTLKNIQQGKRGKEALFDVVLTAVQSDATKTHLSGAMTIDVASSRMLDLDAAGAFELPDEAESPAASQIAAKAPPGNGKQSGNERGGDSRILGVKGAMHIQGGIFSPTEEITE